MVPLPKADLFPFHIRSLFTAQLVFLSSVIFISSLIFLYICYPALAFCLLLQHSAARQTCWGELSQQAGQHRVCAK